MRAKTWGAVIMLSLLVASGPARAETSSPLQTIKSTIDRVIAVLNDPMYNQPGKREEQRKKLWEIARPMFDFKEISRRTVGPAWSRFSEEQKEQFTKVFTEFLGNTYLDKIQGEYNDQKVVYLKELVRDSVALVRTELVHGNVSLPIDYRMMLENGQWKIYDILVENGVSIVQNYRVQFQSFLQKDTPAQLIDRLEQKLKEQKS